MCPAITRLYELFLAKNANVVSRLSTAQHTIDHNSDQRGWHGGWGRQVGPFSNIQISFYDVKMSHCYTVVILPTSACRQVSTSFTDCQQNDSKATWTEKEMEQNRYRVAQNKIPHQTICNISITSGLILKILKAD